MTDSLTFVNLLAIQDVILAPLYYATDENMEEDKILWSKETSHTPEFVVFHPDKLEEMKANAKSIGRRLIHIRDCTV